MQRWLYAVPMALLFMTLSDQWSPAGFLVGYIIGVGVLLLTGDGTGRIAWGRLPAQLAWLVVYILRLAWDILLSGFDVARRVLDPRLPIDPGELGVSTQDPRQQLAISALSAHAITVTPGEMVVDFTQEGGELVMNVHALDAENSQTKMDDEQTQRLKLLRRIIKEQDV